ncbi:MAG: hypothetical protein ABJF23_02195 [Bryobacteraceae bacterium]
MFFALLAALLLATPMLRADLADVRNEPNLEKRSEKALENANTAMDEAKKAYKARDFAGFKARVQEVEESAELSYLSLEETGKAARRSPKFFKRSEMKIHALTKRLEALAAEVSLEDRGLVEAARKNLSDLEDKIVFEIMTKKH